MNKLFALFVFVPTLALAGDISTTEFLGFTADGSAAGFRQFGISDGTGYPYCEYMVIDTVKNEYLISPWSSTAYIESEEEISTEVACTASRKKVAKKLALYKFDPKLGTRTFTCKLGDEETCKQVSFNRAGDPSQNNDYTVKITETPGGPENEFGLVPQLMKIGVTIGDNNEIVLQQDTKLKKNRRNVYNYALEEGYYYLANARKAVYVFTVRQSTPGFEGPNIQTMLVSGQDY